MLKEGEQMALHFAVTFPLAAAMAVVGANSMIAFKSRSSLAAQLFSATFRNSGSKT